MGLFWKRPLLHIGQLSTIKVRYKNETADLSSVSIKDAFNNLCDQNTECVTATYETGYIMTDDYIVKIRS